MVENQPQLPFEPPRDPEEVIWRYTDFTKFVAMLDTRSLWFSRIDCLGDPYEGSTPRAEVQFWETMRTNEPDRLEIAGHNERLFRGMARHQRSRTYVNCWHINEHESAAMWKLYSSDDASIAMQSSYSRFREVLPNQVDIGVVKYIDYDAEHVPFNNIINYCMHKRRSFEHERELRALIWGLGIDDETKESKWPVELSATGTTVEIDLVKLVTKVVIAPFSPPWFEQLVRSVVSKYGFSFEVRRSRMEDAPLL